MKKKPYDLLYAKIYTWAGVSFNAEHYYIELIGDVRTQVYKPLSAREIKLLNKKDIERGYSGTMWKKGSFGEGFLTKEDAENFVIGLAKHFPKSIMVRGSTISHPNKILYAPSEVSKIVDSLNTLWEAYRECYKNTNDPYSDKTLAPLVIKAENAWTAVIKNLVSWKQTVKIPKEKNEMDIDFWQRFLSGS